jgi:hypothetical protein
MRHFTRLSVFILLLLGSGPASAQKPGPFGCWPIYFGSAALDNRWGIWGEAQYRSYDFAGDLDQLLLRTAVTYNLDSAKNVQLAQGYAYVRSEPYIAGTEAKRMTEEHRLYQQLILRQRWGRFYLQHRYRIEERFLQDNNFRMRFRYFLSANFCLNKKSLGAGTVYLSAYNELFIHNDQPFFDRDRIFGGLGYGLSRSLRVEAGPMWQQVATTGRPQLLVQVFHNFHF